MIGGQPMKAIVYEKYGNPEVLKLKEVDRPTYGDHDILVRIHMTTVTAGDWRLRKASPFLARLYNGLFRPKKVNILGFEFAGEVVAIGRQVTRYQIGDRVVGHNGFLFGGYAQYIALPETGFMAHIPDKVSYDEAVSLPIGGVGAYYSLQHSMKGKKVLINGASGSVGTYALQLAVHFGGEVTAVCSSKNHPLVLSLGATKVIDYQKENVLDRDERYDIIFDAVGKHVSKISQNKFKKILSNQGTFYSIEHKRKSDTNDLKDLLELIKIGAIKTIKDSVHSMDTIKDAHAYVEKGHKVGNVLVTID